MLSLSGAMLSAAGSTRCLESALALSSWATAGHKTTDSSAVGLLPLQKRAGKAKQHSSGLSCCVAGAVQALFQNK